MDKKDKDKFDKEKINSEMIIRVTKKEGSPEISMEVEGIDVPKHHLPMYLLAIVKTLISRLNKELTLKSIKYVIQELFDNKKSYFTEDMEKMVKELSESEEAKEIAKKKNK